MAPASRNFSSLFAACLLFTLCSALEKVDLHESHIVPRAYSSTIKHLSDVVHGTIMGLAVIVIFPFGIMSWKLLGHVLSPRWLLRVHVGCQILGMALLITGFGTGVWVAILHAEVYDDPMGHVIFGTIIVALFLLQPVIGTWHHQLFKASKTNKALRYGHIWFGRILLIAAVINGGTGLKIGNNSTAAEIVWGTLAGVIAVVYIALIALSYFTKSSGSGENSEGDVSVDIADVEGKEEKKVAL